MSDAAALRITRADIENEALVWVAGCVERPRISKARGDMMPARYMLALLSTASALIARPPASELLNRLSPATIAYLGDAVFETAVRERLLWPPAKINEVSSRVQAVVCAEGQHALLQRITADFGLTEEEHDWLRRGRNASGRGPRRLDPKVYRAASSLETLVGVLHLTDPGRLGSLLEFVLANIPDPDETVK